MSKKKAKKKAVKTKKEILAHLAEIHKGHKKLDQELKKFKDAVGNNPFGPPPPPCRG